MNSATVFLAAQFQVIPERGHLQVFTRKAFERSLKLKIGRLLEVIT